MNFMQASYKEADERLKFTRLTVVKLFGRRRTVALNVRNSLFFIGLVFSMLGNSVSAAESQSAKRDGSRANMDLQLWRDIGYQADIDWKLLFAISLQESQRPSNGIIHPWPWAINSNGGGCFCKSYDEAVAKIESLMAAGYKSIDVGLMQVNLKWHGYRVDGDFRELLRPSTNLIVGADILSEAMRSTDSLQVGISRYHSWKEEIGTPYAVKVLRIYAAIEKLKWS